MTDKKKEPNAKINLSISKEVAVGTYSNLIISNFSKEEFMLDFALLQPHIKKADITSRVILSPRNAKKLASILAKNIEEYEKNIGPITDGPPSPGVNISFN